MVSGKSDKIGAGRKVLANRYERKFRRGTLIFIEGELSTEMFILRMGSVRILKQEGENTFELAVLGPGSVLGELSLLDHQPRGATAQVIEDVTATIIDEELLHRTLEKVPSWLSNIINVIVKRLRDTMKRTSDDIVRSSVAGTIRIMLLLHSSEGAEEGGLAVLPLNRLKEVVYATIGLGGMETENVLLHLILKEMLFIRKDSMGREHVHIRDRDVVQLYLNYLRAKQRGGVLVGESFSEAATGLLVVIRDTGGKNGRIVKDKLVQIGLPQVELELERRDKGSRLDMDALDELVAAKVIVIEQATTESAHGHHKRSAIVYNRDTISRLLLLQEWLAAFREDVKF